MNRVIYADMIRKLHVDCNTVFKDFMNAPHDFIFFISDEANQTDYATEFWS